METNKEKESTATISIQNCQNNFYISRVYKAIIHHPTIYDMRGQDTVGVKQQAYDEECEIELIEEDYRHDY